MVIQSLFLLAAGFVLLVKGADCKRAAIEKKYLTYTNKRMQDVLHG